jgi:Trypsin-like peptidase domain/WD domain, G-beta repeat
MPLRQRVVEVIADLGETRPRWRYGSGLLVGGRQLLTAAHVVAGAVAVTVRGPDKVALPADMDTALIGDPDRLDLALLAVPAAPALPGVAVALVDRDVTTGEVIEGCWAVGYPSFQEVARDVAESVRETAQVRGWIPPLSGLVGDLLSLQVTATPKPLPAEQTRLGQSEWSGMSGAAVFAGEALVGVVTEHAPRRGSSEVTVIPLDRLIEPATAPPDAAGWWARLGIGDRDPAGLPRLPAGATRREPAYRASLRKLRGRTKVLIGREDELAQIAAFATGTDNASSPDTVSDGYLWLLGGPWAGKTALLAEAVQTMPGSVDVVAFFLVAREGRASREEFLGAVVPQLAWLLDRDPPAAVDVDVFNDLWEQAAQQAEAHDRRLLLVVDGLDEDLRPDRRSVAALLPTQGLGRHARVLVASRPYPDLPDDVEAHHPLRLIQHTETQVLLQSSPHASELQVMAEQEIDGLLESVPARDPAADLIQDVLGALTAAAGALSVEDLAALTNDRQRIIREFVTKQAGRSLEPVGPEDDRSYQFAHQTLLQRCQRHPDIGGEPRYRTRLHAWAKHWGDQGWPAPGRDGPGTPRYLLDAYPSALAGDPSRLTALVSDVGWVDAAIQSTGVDRVLADLRSAATANQTTPAVEAMLATVSGQAHHLRASSPVTQPGYVLRQLWMQAAELGEERPASDLRARLRSQPDSDLIPIWTTRRASRALSAELGRHDDAVYALAVLPDGRVVSGGEDLRVLVWDLTAPGADPVELGRHDDAVYALAGLPDGRVVSGGEDLRVLVWDPGRPGTDPVELGRHDGPVDVVAVLPDGRVVSGGEDRRVLIWNATTQEQVAQLECSVIGLVAVHASRGEASLLI